MFGVEIVAKAVKINGNSVSIGDLLNMVGLLGVFNNELFQSGSFLALAVVACGVTERFFGLDGLEDTDDNQGDTNDVNPTVTSVASVLNALTLPTIVNDAVQSNVDSDSDEGHESGHDNHWTLAQPAIVKNAADSDSSSDYEDAESNSDSDSDDEYDAGLDNHWASSVAP